jgi:hypothetical protein
VGIVEGLEGSMPVYSFGLTTFPNVRPYLPPGCVTEHWDGCS